MYCIWNEITPFGIDAVVICFFHSCLKDLLDFTVARPPSSCSDLQLRIFGVFYTKLKILHFGVTCCPVYSGALGTKDHAK